MFHQSIADETAFTRTLWIQQRVMTLGDSMRLSWAVIKKERTDAASDKFNASDDLSHQEIVIYLDDVLIFQASFINIGAETEMEAISQYPLRV